MHINLVVHREFYSMHKYMQVNRTVRKVLWLPLTPKVKITDYSCNMNHVTTKISLLSHWQPLSEYTKLTCITDGPTQRLLLAVLAVSLATTPSSFSPSRATEHTCDVRLLAICSGQLVSFLETHVPIHAVVAQLIV